jgi:hypothetical protein
VYRSRVRRVPKDISTVPADIWQHLCVAFLVEFHRAMKILEEANLEFFEFSEFWALVSNPELKIFFEKAVQSGHCCSYQLLFVCLMPRIKKTSLKAKVQ